jgi:uncharacterized membrane protein
MRRERRLLAMLFVGLMVAPPWMPADAQGNPVDVVNRLVGDLAGAPGQAEREVGRVVPNGPAGPQPPPLANVTTFENDTLNEEQADLAEATDDPIRTLYFEGFEGPRSLTERGWSEEVLLGEPTWGILDAHNRSVSRPDGSSFEPLFERTPLFPVKDGRHAATVMNPDGRYDARADARLVSPVLDLRYVRGASVRTDDAYDLLTKDPTLGGPYRTFLDVWKGTIAGLQLGTSVPPPNQFTWLLVTPPSRIHRLFLPGALGTQQVLADQFFYNPVQPRYGAGLVNLTFFHRYDLNPTLADSENGRVPNAFQDGAFLEVRVLYANGTAGPWEHLDGDFVFENQVDKGTGGVCFGGPLSNCRVPLSGVAEVAQGTLSGQDDYSFFTSYYEGRVKLRSAQGCTAGPAANGVVDCQPDVPAFVGSSFFGGSGRMVKSHFTLNRFAGEQIQLAWRLHSGHGAGDPREYGWSLDAVKLEALVPLRDPGVHQVRKPRPGDIVPTNAVLQPEAVVKNYGSVAVEGLQVNFTIEERLPDAVQSVQDAADRDVASAGASVDPRLDPGHPRVPPGVGSGVPPAVDAGTLPSADPRVSPSLSLVGAATGATRQPRVLLQTSVLVDRLGAQESQAVRSPLACTRCAQGLYDLRVEVSLRTASGGEPTGAPGRVEDGSLPNDNATVPFEVRDVASAQLRLGLPAEDILTDLDERKDIHLTLSNTGNRDLGGIVELSARQLDPATQRPLAGSASVPVGSLFVGPADLPAGKALTSFGGDRSTFEGNVTWEPRGQLPGMYRIDAAFRASPDVRPSPSDALNTFIRTTPLPYLAESFAARDAQGSDAFRGDHVEHADVGFTSVGYHKVVSSAGGHAQNIDRMPRGSVTTSRTWEATGDDGMFADLTALSLLAGRQVGVRLPTPGSPTYSYVYFTPEGMYVCPLAKVTDPTQDACSASFFSYAYLEDTLGVNVLYREHSYLDDYYLTTTVDLTDCGGCNPVLSFWQAGNFSWLGNPDRVEVAGALGTVTLPGEVQSVSADQAADNHSRGLVEVTLLDAPSPPLRKDLVHGAGVDSVAGSLDVAQALDVCGTPTAGAGATVCGAAATLPCVQPFDTLAGAGVNPPPTPSEPLNRQLGETASGQPACVVSVLHEPVSTAQRVYEARSPVPNFQRVEVPLRDFAGHRIGLAFHFQTSLERIQGGADQRGADGKCKLPEQPPEEAPFCIGRPLDRWVLDNIRLANVPDAFLDTAGDSTGAGENTNWTRWANFRTVRDVLDADAVLSPACTQAFTRPFGTSTQELTALAGTLANTGATLECAQQSGFQHLLLSIDGRGWERVDYGGVDPQTLVAHNPYPDGWFLDASAGFVPVGRASGDATALRWGGPGNGGTYPAEANGVYAIASSPLMDLSRSSTPLAGFQSNHSFARKDASTSDSKAGVLDGGTLFLARYVPDGRGGWALDRRGHLDVEGGYPGFVNFGSTLRADLGLPWARSESADRLDRSPNGLVGISGGASDPAWVQVRSGLLTGLDALCVKRVDRPGEPEVVVSYDAAECDAAFVNATTSTVAWESGVGFDSDGTRFTNVTAFDQDPDARYSLEFHAQSQSTDLLGNPLGDYGWAIDDLRVGEQFLANDLGVTQVVFPPPGRLVGPGEEVQVKVNVTNFGLFAQHGYRVHLNVTQLGVQVFPPPAEGESVVQQVSPGRAVQGLRSPSPQHNDTVAFERTWTPDAPGVFTIQAWSEIVGENVAGRLLPMTDEDPLNDLFRQQVEVRELHAARLVGAARLPDEQAVQPLVGTPDERRHIVAQVENIGTVSEGLDVQDCRPGEPAPGEAPCALPEGTGHLVPRRLNVTLTITDEAGQTVLPRPGEPAVQQSISLIAPGGRVPVSFDWDPPAGGLYTVRLGIDMPSDLTLGDNERVVKVLVLTRLIPRPGESWTSLFCPVGDGWSGGARASFAAGEGWSFGTGASYGPGQGASLMLGACQELGFHGALQELEAEFFGDYNAQTRACVEGRALGASLTVPGLEVDHAFDANATRCVRLHVRTATDAAGLDLGLPAGLARGITLEFFGGLDAQGKCDPASRVGEVRVTGRPGKAPGGLDEDASFVRCVRLTIGQALDLTTFRSAVLSIQHRFDLEEGYDGGLVEVSPDGERWLAVEPLGGYPATLTTASPEVQRPGDVVRAFTGKSGGSEAPDGGALIDSIVPLGTVDLTRTDPGTLFRDAFEADEPLLGGAVQQGALGQWTEVRTKVAPPEGRAWLVNKSIVWTGELQGQRDSSVYDGFTLEGTKTLRLASPVRVPDLNGSLVVEFTEWRSLGLPTRGHETVPSTYRNHTSVEVLLERADGAGAPSTANVTVLPRGGSTSLPYDDNQMDWTRRAIVLPGPTADPLKGHGVRLAFRLYLANSNNEALLRLGQTQNVSGTGRPEDTDYVGPFLGWAIAHPQLYFLNTPKEECDGARAQGFRAEFREGRCVLFEDELAYDGTDAAGSVWQAAWQTESFPKNAPRVVNSSAMAESYLGAQEAARKAMRDSGWRLVDEVGLLSDDPVWDTRSPAPARSGHGAAALAQGSGQDARLITPLNLRAAAGEVTLALDQSFKFSSLFETTSTLRSHGAYAGGRVEVSRDGGASWEPLAPSVGIGDSPFDYTRNLQAVHFDRTYIRGTPDTELSCERSTAPGCIDAQDPFRAPGGWVADGQDHGFTPTLTLSTPTPFAPRDRDPERDSDLGLGSMAFTDSTCFRVDVEPQMQDPCQGPEDWQQVSFDLSRYAGQDVLLAFHAWFPTHRFVRDDHVGCAGFDTGCTETASAAFVPRDFWRVDNVTVQASVLDGKPLLVRLRAFSDPNGERYGWDVANVSLLGDEHLANLGVRILSPRPGEPLLGSSSAVQAVLQNKGQQPLAARAMLLVEQEGAPQLRNAGFESFDGLVLNTGEGSPSNWTWVARDSLVKNYSFAALLNHVAGSTLVGTGVVPGIVGLDPAPTPAQGADAFNVTVERGVDQPFTLSQTVAMPAGQWQLRGRFYLNITDPPTSTLQGTPVVRLRDVATGQILLQADARTPVAVSLPRDQLRVWRTFQLNFTIEGQGRNVTIEVAADKLDGVPFLGILGLDDFRIEPLPPLQPDMGPLRNGGFEAGLEGWSLRGPARLLADAGDSTGLVTACGAICRRDHRLVPEGAQELALEGVGASAEDAVLWQNVSLAPAKYRFSGLIATRNVSRFLTDDTSVGSVSVTVDPAAPLVQTLASADLPREVAAVRVFPVPGPSCIAGTKATLGLADGTALGAFTPSSDATRCLLLADRPVGVPVNLADLRLTVSATAPGQLQARPGTEYANGLLLGAAGLDLRATLHGELLPGNGTELLKEGTGQADRFQLAFPVALGQRVPPAAAAVINVAGDFSRDIAFTPLEPDLTSMHVWVNVTTNLTTVPANLASAQAHVNKDTVTVRLIAPDGSVLAPASQSLGLGAHVRVPSQQTDQAVGDTVEARFDLSRALCPVPATLGPFATEAEALAHAPQPCLTGQGTWVANVTVHADPVAASPVNLTLRLPARNVTASTDTHRITVTQDGGPVTLLVRAQNTTQQVTVPVDREILAQDIPADTDVDQTVPVDGHHVAVDIAGGHLTLTVDGQQVDGPSGLPLPDQHQEQDVDAHTVRVQKHDTTLTLAVDGTSQSADVPHDAVVRLPSEDVYVQPIADVRAHPENHRVSVEAVPLNYTTQVQNVFDVPLEPSADYHVRQVVNVTGLDPRRIVAVTVPVQLPPMDTVIVHDPAEQNYVLRETQLWGRLFDQDGRPLSAEVIGKSTGDVDLRTLKLNDSADPLPVLRTDQIGVRFNFTGAFLPPGTTAVQVGVRSTNLTGDKALRLKGVVDARTGAAQLQDGWLALDGQAAQVAEGCKLGPVPRGAAVHGCDLALDLAFAREGSVVIDAPGMQGVPVRLADPTGRRTTLTDCTVTESKCVQPGIHGAQAFAYDFAAPPGADHAQLRVRLDHFQGEVLLDDLRLQALTQPAAVFQADLAPGEGQPVAPGGAPPEVATVKGASYRFTAEAFAVDGEGQPFPELVLGDNRVELSTGPALGPGRLVLGKVQADPNSYNLTSGVPLSLQVTVRNEGADEAEVQSLEGSVEGLAGNKLFHGTQADLDPVPDTLRLAPLEEATFRWPFLPDPTTPAGVYRFDARIATADVGDRHVEPDARTSLLYIGSDFHSQFGFYWPVSNTSNVDDNTFLYNLGACQPTNRQNPDCLEAHTPVFTRWTSSARHFASYPSLCIATGGAASQDDACQQASDAELQAQGWWFPKTSIVNLSAFRSFRLNQDCTGGEAGGAQCGFPFFVRGGLPIPRNGTVFATLRTPAIPITFHQRPQLLYADRHDMRTLDPVGHVYARLVHCVESGANPCHQELSPVFPPNAATCDVEPKQNGWLRVDTRIQGKTNGFQAKKFVTRSVDLGPLVDLAAQQRPDLAQDHWDHVQVCWQLEQPSIAVPGVQTLREWDIDDVFVTPYGMELGPEQTVPIHDNVTKDFRLILRNRGAYTDTYDVRLEDEVALPSTGPENWRFDLLDEHARPLREVRAQPGEERVITVRVHVDVAPPGFPREGKLDLAVSAISRTTSFLRSTQHLLFNYTFPDRPNLRIAGIIVNDATLAVDKPRTVDVLVQNTGTVAALGAELEVLDKMDPGFGVPAVKLLRLDGSGIPPLDIAPGDLRAVTVNWVPSVPGEHNITAIADPEREVLEFDERDNVMVRPIVVPRAEFPDLLVEASASSLNPTPGDVVEVTARVLNKGGTDAQGVQVTMRAGVTDLLQGEPPHILPQSIAPGDGVTLNVSFRAAFPGEQFIFIRAVPRAGTLERLETIEDNTFVLRVKVRSRGLDMALPQGLTAEPGQTVQAPVTVFNRGDVDDSYLLQLVPPDDWRGQFLGFGEEARVGIGNHSQVNLTFQVTPPPHAESGPYLVLLHARSENTSEVLETGIQVDVPQHFGLRFGLEPDLLLQPGRRYLPVQLANRGNGVDFATVTATSLPAGWSVEPATFAVPPKASLTAMLNITIPTTTPEAAYPVELQAQGRGGDKLPAKGLVQVLPLELLVLAVQGLAGTLLPGQSVEGTLVVTNQGNLAARAELTVQAPPGWHAKLGRDVASMGPGEQRSLDLSLTVPQNATNEPSALRVLARSGRDARFEALQPVRAARADLAAGDFDLLPRGVVRDGGLVTLQVRVRNQGETSAGAPVAVYVDDALMGFEQVPDLQPGQEALVNASFKVQHGEHVVLVVVDPGKALGEEDEDNNARLRVLHVEGGGAFFAVPALGPMLAALAVAALAAARRRVGK